LQDRYPGIQALGWSRYLAPADLAAQPDDEGARAEVRLFPPGEREHYLVITYISPLDWRNKRALGFDMLSEPMRLQAVQAAIDSGEARLTGPIVLRQDEDNSPLKGLVLFMPVYGRDAPATATERREAFIGTVYGAFRVQDLMAGILGAQTRLFDIELADLQYPDQPLLDPPDAAEPAPYQDRRELRLFGREHTLLFGYSTLTQREYTPYTENVLPAGYASWDDYLRIPDWRTWDGNVPRFDSIRYGHDSYRSRVKQTAGFFAARLNFTDALKAVVGARYSSWETASEERYNPAGILEARNGYKVDDVLTPYAGMLYDINDNLTAYGSYTNIFKPQEYRDRNNRYLDPIEGDSYELGLKGEFLNGGLNASAAVFRSEQDNLAEIDDSVPPRIINGSPTYAYKSTGKGNKVEGWELEVQGQINEDWNIAGGFTHAKAENAAGVRINTMQPVDLFRLNTYYRLPGRWNRLSVGGGVTWQGKLTGTGNRPTGAYNPDGTPITQRAPLEQPSFHLLNLSASYRFSDNITASLNVNNLLDKAYYSRMGFYNGVHWGEPRNITLNLRIRL